MEADSSAHQMLREGLLSIRADVKSSTASAAARSPVAAASPSGRSGGVGVVVFGKRHCIGSIRVMSGEVVFVYRAGWSVL